MDVIALALVAACELPLEQGAADSEGSGARAALAENGLAATYYNNIDFTGSTDVGHILAAAIVLTGLVGTARLILTDVTLSQLYYGLLVGVFGQMIAWFVGGVV